MFINPTIIELDRPTTIVTSYTLDVHLDTSLNSSSNSIATSQNNLDLILEKNNNFSLLGALPTPSLSSALVSCKTKLI